MAISKIKKIEILGLEKDKEEALALLQKLGLVELISIQESALARGTETTAIETNLLQIAEAITYLSSFQEDAGFLEGMVKLRPLVYQQELQEVVTSFNYKELVHKLSQLRSDTKNLLQQKERLIQERQLLTPWQALKIPLEQIHSTSTCGIVLGILRRRDYINLLNDCKKNKIDLFCETVNQDKTNSYLAILYLKDEFERLEQLLKNHRFNFITLSRRKGTAQDRLLEINREILVLDDQIQDAKKRTLELSKEQFKLMVIYDYLDNIKKRQDVDGYLAKQQYTFLVRGLIRKKETATLEKELSHKFKDIAIFISDPKPGEDIPTALENKPMVSPFEAVTNLYGQPLYNGLDPTKFLAPFFAVSFAFCLLDAGYGLLLSAIVLIFLRKKQISAAAKNFLRLFLFMGIATIFAGLITGSFFGDLIFRLPKNFSPIQNILKRFILFDPVKDSLLFLGLTLALGFIQIWIGVLIMFFKSLRTDRFRAFVLDLPTLLVQTSLLMLGLVFAKALPAFMLKISGILFVIAASLVIFYQFKANREISLKIFWSIFGVYSIVTGNFLADTLSFSRIFALGLTGGLLGMAINTMLFPKGEINNVFALLGAVIAILILFISHLLNLGISILGAYVHTSRLQYLEFFTKFFESGGRPFRPFREEAKYIFLAKTK